MMHDFAVTERHVVFLLCPIVFDLENAAKGSVFAWRPGAARASASCAAAERVPTCAGSRPIPATSSTR